MVPWVQKWELTRSIECVESPRHIAICSMLRKLFRRKIAHCMSGDIFLPRGMSVMQSDQTINEVWSNQLTVHKSRNPETLKPWKLHPGWPKSCSISQCELFGVIFFEFWLLVEEIWSKECRRVFVYRFLTPTSHVKSTVNNSMRISVLCKNDGPVPLFPPPAMPVRPIPHPSSQCPSLDPPI